MKCEVKRRIEVNAEEKEKLLYLKRELEKKGLKVKISVDNSNSEEGSKEVEYLGREMTKMPNLWGYSETSETSTVTTTSSNFWENKEFMKSREKKQNPKEIMNPYRSFKEMLDGEKEEAMLELKGGGWKKEGGGEPIDGMKYDLREVVVKIEVET